MASMPYDENDYIRDLMNLLIFVNNDLYSQTC